MNKITIHLLILSLVILISSIIIVTAFENPSTYQKPLGGGSATPSATNANLPTIRNIKIIFGENSASGDYEAAKLIKNKLLINYNVILIKDVDYSDDGSSSVVSIGGSCINKVSAQLLSLSYPKCGNDFTTSTKVASNQYLIKTSKLSNNRIAIVIAGFEAQDTWIAANYFNTLDINNLATDLNIIKNASLIF